MSVLMQGEPEAAAEEYSLEQSLARLLWAQLAWQGWLSGTSGLAPRYTRWREAGLRMLRGRGLRLEEVAPDWETAWSQWQAYRGLVRDDVMVAAQLRLLDAVLPALAPILRGHRAATEVLFPQGQLSLVEGVYRDHPVADYFNGVLAERLEAYVRARVAHDPRVRLRILEVGAGTGGTSAGLFAQLAPYARHVEEYCYTDVSPAFLQHAREHYEASAPYLLTRRLDIEHSPLAQGFELGHYDVAVAANVLHATRDIRNTLRQVKTLLKANGLLLLNELSGASLFLHLTFGLLEGWWLAEDEAVRIPGTPALSRQGWRDVLAAEGFAAIATPAQAAHALGQQIIVATSDGVVRVEHENRLPLTECRTSMPAQTPDRSVLSPIRTQTTTTPVRQQAHVRQVIRTSIAQSLALNEAELQDDQVFATYGIDSITGVALINTINTRLELTLPTTVLFDHATIAQLSAHISTTYRERLSSVTPDMDTVSAIEAEAEVETKTEKVISSPIVKRRRRRAEPSDAAPLVAPRNSQATGPRYRRVWLDRPGTIDDLRIVEDRLSPLGAYEVRIAVRAFSLNFGDLLCLKGLYPTQPAYPFTPGFEASGTVVAIGSEVSRVAVGDAVVALAGEALGAHANVLTCMETQVFACPAGLSFEAACAVPAVALTAIECFKRAQLKAGERILILTATGGVGLMALQMAQHVGAEIYATAGSEAKLDFLASQGVSHRINYRKDDFEVAIRRLTAGRGVDVVINTLAGDAIQKGLNCLAPGGRYIEIAMTALKSASSIDLSCLNDNQVLHSVDLRKLIYSKPKALQDAMNEMRRLLDEGVISPTLSRTFTFSDIQNAYRSLEDRQNIGKVVVSIPEADRFEASETTLLARHLEPIAVIGMSGRFPGAPDLDAFWDNLINNRDSIVEIPEDRWCIDGFFNPDRADAIKNGMSYCKWGGFIDLNNGRNFATYDQEKEIVNDVQSRLATESIWGALESAGYTRATLKKTSRSRTGLYLGVMRTLPDQSPDSMTRLVAPESLGNLAGNISKFFNFNGPCIAVDTFSAASMTAIHMACVDLQYGNCDVAVVSGAMCLEENLYRLICKSNYMASGTEKRSFAEGRDGALFGEGAATVILKPLSQAIRDDDIIFATIRSTTSQFGDGSVDLLAKSISENISRSKVPPRSINHVEFSANGSPFGDELEYIATRRVFEGFTSEKNYCSLGTVKPNIGHLGPASGMSQLLKVIMQMNSGQVAPLMNAAAFSPALNQVASPFFLCEEAQPWQRPHVKIDGAAQELPRRALINSLGYGGFYAGAIVEEYNGKCVGERDAHAPTVQAKLEIIILSANTKDDLYVMTKNINKYLKNNPEISVNDLAYTLQIGREAMRYRWAAVTAGYDELLEVLADPFSMNIPEGIQEDRLFFGCVSGSSPQGQEMNDLTNLDHSFERYSDREVLIKIASRWVGGADVPWNKFRASGARRIALPVYPFATS